MVRWSAIILLSLLALQALAQDEKKPKEPGKGDVQATVDVTLLTLDVVATRKDAPVFDLRADEIEVKVSGKPQPLEFFEPPVKPADRPKAGKVDVQDLLMGKAAPPPEELTPEPERRPKLRVLFYLDLEGLPREGLTNAVSLIREYLDTAAGKARLSLAVYSGVARLHVRDEVDSGRIERELDRMLELSTDLPETTMTAAGPSARGRTASTLDVSDVSSRVWELRRKQESEIIDDYLDRKEQGVDDPRRVNAFVFGEHRRVREELEGLRSTLERFAAEGDVRNVVFLSEGLERNPGQNFLSLLETAERQRNEGMFRGRLLQPSGPPSRLDRSAMFVPDFDVFDKWLARSGIRFSYANPIRGDGMARAEDDYVQQSPLSYSTLQSNRQDGTSRFASSTGGFVRSHGEGLNLGQLLEPLRATYRIGVRLQPGTAAGSVSVSSKRKGVKLWHQSAFAPVAAKGPPAVIEGRRVDEALAEARRDDRRRDAGDPGVAPPMKPLTVAARWKGKLHPDERKPGRNLYRLEVTVPYADLRFQPAHDAFLAALRLAVRADGIRNTAGSDDFTSDETPLLTGTEMASPPAAGFVRVVLLSLPPGWYRITAAATDALDERSGLTVLEVKAER